MARTFSYQKQQRNRQTPPTRTTWQKPRTERRGKYAALADRVHEHRMKITQAANTT